MTRGIHIEDLPPATAAQVREKAGLREPRKKDRRGATKTATDGICWTCGERFTSTTKFEKHSDSNPGHRRFELLAERTQP